MRVKYIKMHGYGNSYLFVDLYKKSSKGIHDKIIEYLKNNNLKNTDGIITIEKSKENDVHAKMRIFNIDGSEGKMCGNGIRCFAKYLIDNKYVDTNDVHIETLSGIKRVVKINDMYKVEMGKPGLASSLIPVNYDKDIIINEQIMINNVIYKITCVSMGNPHTVIFVDNLEDINMQEIGPVIENYYIFPERTNVEFVEVIDTFNLKFKVWERGSGETMACGTGACAVVVAANLNSYVNKNEDIFVHMPGGIITINYTENNVYMTGEAENLEGGELEI